ncbi:hypothetical protein PVK06_013724 [Gossypium arboreum]|uniref:Uncharacterized protein n=1 Tax=Gossypium arboreum TaxID=29729 RepID=A0ABR0PSE9_GOSAR|nr:hypothetical protein PVK06_013724 [Gossypium arboreum]
MPGDKCFLCLHSCWQERLNSDSNNFAKLAKFKGMYNFETDLTNLHPILTECSVFKSDLELTLIQVANDISSEAHVEVNGKLTNHKRSKPCV